MPIVLFSNLTEEEKSRTVKKLISGSTASQDFFFMTLLAIVMAAFGLLINNIPVVIGSMLIAPVLYPILSLAVGIAMADLKLVGRAFFTILKSVIIGIAAATVVALFFPAYSADSSLILRAEPSILFGLVAIVAGLAASFSASKPQLNENLPGVAISVALIPPLAAVGIGIARLEWSIASNAFLLFLVNAVGIVLAALVTFSLMSFQGKKKVAEKQVRKEEQKIEKDIEKAEEEQKQSAQP